MEIKMKNPIFLFVLIFVSFLGAFFAKPLHNEQYQSSNKKLRIVVPTKPGFPELIKIDRNPQTNATTVTGFCKDVFVAAMEAIQYDGDYEFIPFVDANGKNKGTYSDLIHQIYLENFDAAMGDITITANRSLYVDFTLPFTDLGVGMIASKDNKDMWIFLKPLTADLWLSTAAFFILIGFVIWLIERSIDNEEFQGPFSKQIGTVLSFTFSTLVFAHREKLESNLSKFIVIVWVFVVLILTSSYTATLTSMITVQQINTQLKSKESYIGYRLGSLTQMVITNLNFENTNLRPLSTPKDYINALPRGSKNGGVSAIVDEIPYLNIFLAKYSRDYFMVGRTITTNGFGFVFRKGSPLVPELSRAIAKLREDKKLNMMENAWLNSPSILTSDEYSNNVKPLTFARFSGLFLITGISSASALAIFSGFMLYKNWHYLRNCILSCDLNWVRIQILKGYLFRVFTNVLGRRQPINNIIHPVPVL